MISVNQSFNLIEKETEALELGAAEELMHQYISDRNLEIYSESDFLEFKESVLSIAIKIDGGILLEQIFEMKIINELERAKLSVLELAKTEQASFGESVFFHSARILTRVREGLLELQALQKTGQPSKFTSSSIFVEPEALNKLIFSGLIISSGSSENPELLAVEASEHFGVCYLLPKDQSLLFSGVIEQKLAFVVTCCQSDLGQELKAWFSHTNTEFVSTNVRSSRYEVSPDKTLLKLNLAKRSSLVFIQTKDSLSAYYQSSSGQLQDAQLMSAPISLNLSADQRQKANYFQTEYLISDNNGKLVVEKVTAENSHELEHENAKRLDSLFELGQSTVCSAKYGTRIVASKVDGITYCIPHNSSLVFCARTEVGSFFLLTSEGGSEKPTYKLWSGGLNNPLKEHDDVEVKIDRVERRNFLIATILYNQESEKNCCIKIHSEHSPFKSTYAYSNQKIDGYLKVLSSSESTVLEELENAKVGPVVFDEQGLGL